MHIAAVDIGSARVKVLLGEKRRNECTLVSFKTLDYPNALFTDPHYDGRLLDRFYEINREPLVKCLQELISQLPDDTKYYFTFNSLFSSIYYKSLSVSSTKGLNNAAEFYIKKLADADRLVDYDILSFDRRLGEGEILVYSYKEKPFNDFLELLNELDVDVEVVDFDALCLCNVLEEYSAERESYFLLDFGMTKTTLITMKSGHLRHLQVFPKGLLSVYERISRRFGISIREAEDLLLAEDDQRMNIAEFTPEDFLEPFLVQLRKEIDAAELSSAQMLISGGFLTHEPFLPLLEAHFDRKLQLFDPFPGGLELQQRTPYIIAYGLLLR